MRLVSLTLTFLFLLSACTSPTAVPPTSTPAIPTPTGPAPALTGQWMGAATEPDGRTASIQIIFSDSESKLNIEPFTHLWELNFEQNNETIHFTATGETREPFQKIEFTGTFVNNVLSGELNWDGTRSVTTFTPITSVDKTILEKYEGVYRFESGRALSVIVSPEYSSGGMYFFSQSLMLTDFDNGASRSVYPLDNTTFAVGVLRVEGAPFAGRIQFSTDAKGQATGLTWWSDINSKDAGEFAERVPYTSEDRFFTSADGTKLIGRLSIPKSDTRVPAFMGLHGSEPGTRDNFGSKIMAHFMISRGFAILNYDKRGVGDSEGVYQEFPSATNLQKLAEDAIAGVEYLASRPEVDAKSIGLIGSSQAGWVIPLAASQSELISHFVILSGPVASTSQEDVFSSYTNDGDTATTNYDDAKITQQLRGMSPGGFNPIPIIETLKQPGLWLWGDVDKSQPVTFGAENLQAIIDSGKNNLSYQIFPGGDHNLNASPNGLFNEIPYSSRIVYCQALTEWLATHVLNLVK